MTIKKRTKKKTYNQRKREQKIRRIVGISVGTALVFAVAILLHIIFGTPDLREQAGMNEYAHEEIENIRVFKVDSTRIDECYTEEHIGVAQFNDDCQYDYVTEQRDYFIEQLKNQLTEGAEDDTYKVLITNAVTCESDIDTVSLIITYQTGELKDKEVSQVTRGVKGYIFNKNNQKPLVWEQVFHADYPEKLNEALGEDHQPFKAYAIDNKELTYFFEGEDNTITAASIDTGTSEGWLRNKVLERYVDPDKPMVALTYDDGPSTGSETRIHNVLEKYDAVATFFYSGYMIKGKEYQLKRALNNGCEIGSHTWNHPVLTRCSDKELDKQLNKTNKAIEAACGHKPTVFRPSYGATNKEINKKSGLPVILWTIDTLDWESRDAKQVYKKVVKNKKLDGSIILMHCIYDSTAEATEKIVPWLYDHGYQMVTVSELIEAKTGSKPAAGKVYIDVR